MTFPVDHIVIVVDDLEQTIRDYTALGFTVVPGGEHPGGRTHNALVAFADGAYLELIAFKQPTPGFRWWEVKERAGEGLVDYALLPTAIEHDLADIRARGLEIAGPNAGGRVRPDGEQLAWQTARAASSDLPFLCGDITPRALRVPEGRARDHANGVVGVAAITVAVAHLSASVARYAALLGAGAARSVPDRPAPTGGIETAVFQLGSAQVTLAAPLADAAVSTPLRGQLATRGEGPYEVTFRVAPHAATGPCDRQLAHGARLERGQ